MDVAAVILESAKQDLPEELIGPPARLLVEEHRRAVGGVAGHLHRGHRVVTEPFAGFRGAIVEAAKRALDGAARSGDDRKSTRLNSSHPSISYAVFCLKKK